VITPSEHSIIGHWELAGGKGRGDPACARIARLTTGYLVELALAEEGWATLYRDPQDGRLWERTYPNSEMHGGGPPALTAVSEEQARAKYGHWA
jgi:hypothetical protein